MSKRTRAVISLVFVMLVWGSSFSVTKKAVEEMPPVYFAFMRFMVASIILLIVTVLRKRPRVTKLPLGIVLLMGLTGVTFYYILFNFSLRFTLASTGALLEGFIPIIIAILAAVFLKEKMGSRQLVGIGISVVGVVLVGFIKMPKETGPDPFTGNLLMVVCIFLWAIYTILSKKVAAHDPLTVITYTTVIGTLFLIPAVLIELHDRSWPIPSGSGWMSIIYLGAIGSAVCYFLYSKAMEQLTAAQVGNFLNLDPVTGAAIAVIFLHESINEWQLAGCAFILTGVWLSTKVSEKAGGH